MSTIFESQPGRLVSIPSDTPRSFTLTFDGATHLQGILTAIQWGGEVSAQVAMSLSNTIHAVALGDRPSPLTVSLLLNEDCADSGNANLQEFLDFYRDNRLADRRYGGRTAPLTVIIGRQAYMGFLLRHANQATATADQQMAGQLSLIVWRL